MKKLIIVAFAVFTGGLTYGQQDIQMTQFMFDKLSVNPGYAGSSNEFCATMFYRQQWSGFEGAPETYLLNAHMPFDQHGVGLSVFRDALGQTESLFARGNYAYQLKNVGGGQLGLGVSVGYLSSQLKNEWVAIDDVASDGSIPNDNVSAGTIDFGFGAYWHTQNVYLGLSATHLHEGELTDMNMTTARHYYLMAGYTHALSSNVDLIPSILVKSDQTSTQMDFNLMGMYKNTLWLAATYRLDDAIAPMIGYRHELNGGRSAIRVGYSYDLTTSELNNYSSGTHEIMLNYCMQLRKPLPPQIYKNVRFL